MGASKKLFEEIQQSIIEAEEGNKSYIEVYIELKEIEDLIKASKEKVRKLAYDEAVNYGEKSFEKYGKKITPSSKTTYNYNHIPWWNRKKSELENIQESAKLVAKNNVEIFDPETGELIPPVVCTYSYFPKIENIK